MDEKKQAKAGAGSWPSRPPSAAVSLYGNEIGLFMRFDYCPKSPQGLPPLSVIARRYFPLETIRCLFPSLSPVRYVRPSPPLQLAHLLLTHLLLKSLTSS